MNSSSNEARSRQIGQKPGDEAIRSSLPTDDPEFLEIAAEFVATLHARASDMRRALAAADASALVQLAHSLKGAGGTAGFGAFTEPAARMESSARSGDLAATKEAFAEVTAIIARIVVSAPEPARSDPST